MMQRKRRGAIPPFEYEGILKEYEDYISTLESTVVGLLAALICLLALGILMMCG